MQSYTHFSVEERESLARLREKGYTIRGIAKEMNRAPSSISRELRRNCNKGTGKYNVWGATTLYLKRRKQCRRTYRFATDTELQEYTIKRLKRLWSPEAIAAIWNREHASERVSHATIYAALRHGLLEGCSKKEHLRRRGKRKHVRGATATIKPEHFLVDRCEEAQNRERVGDWEGDTVLGGIGKGCLVTCIDRKSRYLVAALSPDKTAQSVSSSLIEALRGHEVHTLTLDNGSEFASFKAIEKALETEVYFCDPHSPWQRGSNENINGLLRFFFPKGSDFRLVSPETLADTLSLINLKPRKCLGWLAPADIYFAKCCS